MYRAEKLKVKKKILDGKGHVLLLWCAFREDGLVFFEERVGRLIVLDIECGKRLSFNFAIREYSPENDEDRSYHGKNGSIVEHDVFGKIHEASHERKGRYDQEELGEAEKHYGRMIGKIDSELGLHDLFGPIGKYECQQDGGKKHQHESGMSQKRRKRRSAEIGSYREPRKEKRTDEKYFSQHHYPQASSQVEEIEREASKDLMESVAELSMLRIDLVVHNWMPKVY